MRDRVGSRVKIMTVVKADAYGHGLKQIAALLMQSGTDVFGVANLAEARSIRAVGKGWPILMLGACLPEEIDPSVRDEIMPTLSSLEEASAFSAAASRLRKTVLAHVKVDTGMGRLGVDHSRAVELVTALAKLPSIKLQGLYTHYSSVEDDADFTREQSRRFQWVVEQVRASGIDIPWIHANNSGGLLHEPDTLYNLVRPGLMVYGLAPEGLRTAGSDLRRHLRPALSWKCRVSFVKTVPAGTPLSYGHTFVAPNTMRLATLTAGYGDGYLRACGSRSSVLIRGVRCRIVGRITMDQMLADVTHVAEVAPGDEVALIGSQGDETITANELALWMGTIPWEVFTSITYRVPRIYTGGEAS